MWRQFLSNWNGISFFYDDNITEAADMQLYTDASGSYGFGGYYQGKWFSEPWPKDLPKLEDGDMSIAFMELVPIVASVVLWQDSWFKKRILFHCDNAATVAIVNKAQGLIYKLLIL